MTNSYLSNEIAGVKNYESPTCEIVLVETHQVLCASDTEHVGEDEGEW